MTSINVSGSRWQRLRIALLIVILAGLYLLARQSGLLEDADPLRLRALVMHWGLYGVLVYTALFSIALFLYVPGTAFIITAGLVYGKLWGIPVALLGANVAINISFFTVRFIGGTPLAQHTHPFVAKLLSGLHSHPIAKIALLRLVFWTAPGLNYLLALSAVKPWQHFLGTLSGTVIPVAATVYLTDWLMLGMFP